MRHVGDVRSHKELNNVLQDEAHANCGDQRGELWRVAKRSIGKPFDQCPDERHHHNRHGEEDDQTDDQGWNVEDCASLTKQRGADGNRDKRGDHEDVAVGKVDEFDDPIDHGVPERDQRVDCAERHRVQELLKPEQSEHQREEPGDDRRQEELAANALGAYGACRCCHEPPFKVSRGI